MLGWVERTKRFSRHELNDEQSKRMEELRAKFQAIAKFIDSYCPDSREKSLAFTHLEQTQFWANSSIAREPKSE